MYQSFIGLEIHIQLQTETKVFCRCKASFGDEPNTNVCPVCMGYPGTLPATNGKAMEMAYLVSRALNCTLAEEAVFDRKNYFYPDLPKNYQISQFHQPVGRDGYFDMEFRKQRKRVRIHDVHLEEDAGKMIHAGDMSLLDFNRTGTPLLEIVTEPDLEFGEEAEVFLQNFRRMVRYLGVCDGNMEEGSLRCDANVSINLRGRGLGNKVEIKNLNSFKFVRKALIYEISRQEEILADDGVVKQETRLWNENRDITESMRSKEEATDYRYFPDPDLPPFRPDSGFLERIEEQLVELPIARRLRLISQYGITEGQADFIFDEKETADFFEAAVRLGADASRTAVWLTSDVQKLLNRENLNLGESPLTPARLAQLLNLLEKEKIHGKIAKQVLEAVFKEDKDPEIIISEKGWEQITDRKELSRIVEKVIRENPEPAAAIAGGDEKPIGFLIGLIMKATSGRAEPGTVRNILKEHFSIKYIHILSMGGGIFGEVKDGFVVPGSSFNPRDFLPEEEDLRKQIKIRHLPISSILSEEITPEDWVLLKEGIEKTIEDGNTSGIIIPHGTDTLPYTASFIYWLFQDTPIPIVFAASVSKECAPQSAMNSAVRRVLEGKPGIFVNVDGKFYSPLNLKFERMDSEGFANWNMEKPVFTAREQGAALAGKEKNRDLGSLMQGTYIVKVFPGMRPDVLISMINMGIQYFILEIYDTGTAILRETPYSLKKVFQYGQEKGVAFFCTSQQKGIVDFSEYITSHGLWKQGAVPMGSATTETAYTRLISLLLSEETREDIVRKMEETDAYINIGV